MVSLSMGAIFVDEVTDPLQKTCALRSFDVIFAVRRVTRELVAKVVLCFATSKINRSVGVRV